ncbi:dihydrolipoyllysine-residue acetyltransferase [Marinomonas mediterranea]|uniref:Acetyltransferase component of pyruvate dehydrogenase complex n=1 Tax=Marinomonas mediterranea (strain ATCC 700492 / JCM 21426 / NBRC 103028 / MMB-1) TaxID=717774 RepID=F2K3E8_MARM1|nr:dihydrolipoyllysine-residue acetyltransferase [Marinomonas mediterranea]ADZ91290.1 pyruvate dehydrogenase complex dihydrolipoamide acetyltransferase [Marinomonas mediterranea MMB-1]WCN17411.1 dihydrolipoyllysine-residue acetyltransferase [Marinomonas mediterranea MMB-1]
MSTEIIRVPDIGGSTDVDVIEVSIQVGDMVEVDQSIIVLETDKASMDVPSPVAGKVVSITVKEGDSVSEGDEVLVLEVSGSVADTATPEAVAPVEAAPEVSKAIEQAPAAKAVSSEQPVSVPDIGGATDVDVIEVCVAVGDSVAEGDSLIVLETDKASMDIPAPSAGKVVSVSINVGDTVSEGDAILVLAVESVEDSVSSVVAVAPAPAVEAPAEVAVPTIIPGGVEQVVVPDIGSAEAVDVIEVSVAAGDVVSEGDSLIVLETDKASMDIPAPKTGTVKSIVIKEGDKVSEGDLILDLEVEAQVVAEAPKVVAPVAEKPVVTSEAPKAQATVPAQSAVLSTPSTKVHAGPAVRLLARELGVDLTLVRASGPRGRITKEDLHAYVKDAVKKAESGASKPSVVAEGAGIPRVPEIDFSQWGDVDVVKMSKIQKITSYNMTRSWLNVPHVTQFDKADITDLEAFRKGLKAEMEKEGIKLTPLPFLIKAVAQALVVNPSFNVSLHADGESIVKKKYVHIGIAVDSPVGLVVPVLRDADKKSIKEIAVEANALIKKALAKQLKPADMQGGCFTISSLGAMGGTGFTPIVNTPEVGILGVSKADVEPRWTGKEFEPRTMLPLCLSYDHRAVNGADAGRFMTFLNGLLSDLRRMTL